MTMIAIREHSKIGHIQTPSGFSDYPNQLASRCFLLPSRCLSATYGVAVGNALVSPEDFIVGDSIALSDRAWAIEVLVECHGARRQRILFDEIDIGTRSLELDLAKSITLMSEFGIDLQGRIMHHAGEGQSFLLLEGQISQATDYTIISEQNPTEVLQHSGATAQGVQKA